MHRKHACSRLPSVLAVQVSAHWLAYYAIPCLSSGTLNVQELWNRWSAQGLALKLGLWAAQSPVPKAGEGKFR